jgi:acetylornithine/N-succinyldiaminopimelate aminotransferase
VTIDEVFASYKENILPTYTKVPLVFVKGKGSRLWDLRHKEYLDFFPGWGVGNLGHCHPKVMQAVREQVGSLIFVPNNYHHIAQAKLAKELIAQSFPGKVFFCNSGAEANEGAFKLARKFGQGRFEIITFENAFHGRTLAALTATGQKKYMEGFGPFPEGFRQAKFNDLDSVRALVGENTVGVILELVQGEGGINIATPEFVQGLRELCDRKKLLLIVDEVQTGVGRTGRMFAYQHYGIVPDVMTLAKALGGGLPIGCMVVRKEISEVLQPGMHASTFGGGPVICRAALAVLKAAKEGKLAAAAKEKGASLMLKLQELAKEFPVIKEVRGLGLMIGIELTLPGKDIVAKCMEKGLLINCTHDTVLRIMPSLLVTEAEMNKAVRILRDVFVRCAR